MGNMLIDKIKIAGQRLCQETPYCKHATEGRGATGSGGKHAGNYQASPGAAII